MSGKVKNNWEIQWKWLQENHNEALRSGFSYSLDYCQPPSYKVHTPLKSKEHKKPTVITRQTIDSSFGEEELPGVLDLTNEARQITAQNPVTSKYFPPTVPPLSLSTSFTPTANSFQDDFSDLDRIDIEDDMEPMTFSTIKTPFQQPLFSPTANTISTEVATTPNTTNIDEDFELPSISPPIRQPLISPLASIEASKSKQPTTPRKNEKLGEYSKDKKFPWTLDLKRNARNIFGHRDFRPFQLEAMNAAMSGKDVFVLMPTGGGKSLCYQLPAVTSNGVCIVISPLVALIRDQVESLAQNGVKANYVGSGQSDEITNQIYQDLQRTTPELKLLYATPEKLMQSPKLLRTLDNLHTRKLLSFFVVDEAHCVSHWGHEFRPDYMQLNLLRERYHGSNIMALTATATERVQQDIINQLRLKDPIIIQSDFNRPNLFYEVRPKKGKKADEEILDYIRSKPNQTGIIYCLSRNECEEVAKYLKENGISADYYHAQLDSDVRNNVQMSWLNDDIQVIVATIAFGLGINKPEVRFVIHYAFPKSIEGYYQESGRAGRDGGKSECILYYHYKDKRRVEFLINQTIEEAKANGGIDAVYEKQLFENLHRMVAYCENKVDCRRKLQLEYFGVSFNREDCNQGCDNCKNQTHSSATVVDMTKDALNAIQLVDQMLGANDRITLLQVSDVFRGKVSKSARTKGFDSLSLFGCGSQYSKSDAERFLRFLTNEKKVFKEQTIMNGMGYPSTYLALNPANAIEFKKMKPKVSFSLTGVEKRTGTSAKKRGTEREEKKNVDGVLKEALRKLRFEISKQDKIPPYMVFSENALDEMCSKKPSNLTEFYNINGVGKIKLQKYGERFVKAIADVLSGTSDVKSTKGMPKKSPYFRESKAEEIDVISDDEFDSVDQASKKAHIY